jgi:hypothetical protein
MVLFDVEIVGTPAASFVLSAVVSLLASSDGTEIEAIKLGITRALLGRLPINSSFAYITRHK